MTTAFHACGLHEVAAGDGWLSPWEARRVGSMRFPKRRLETLLGRWTAKVTIGRALGLPVADWVAADPSRLAAISVENLPSGAPTAYLDGEPAGLEISMTDRADWAVCIVGEPSRAIPAGGSQRVGCDLELVEPRSERFVDDWFTAREREVVRASTDRALFANLVWSAKESALKVLQTGLRRDTRTVEVMFDDRSDESLPNAAWSAFEVRVLDTPELGPFPGWWRRFGAFVLTCAAEQRVPPPTPLDGPSPLETAVPSHAWLDHR